MKKIKMRKYRNLWFLLLFSILLTQVSTAIVYLNDTVSHVLTNEIYYYNMTINVTTDDKPAITFALSPTWTRISFLDVVSERVMDNLVFSDSSGTYFDSVSKNVCPATTSTICSSGSCPVDLSNIKVDVIVGNASAEVFINNTYIGILGFCNEATPPYYPKGNKSFNIVVTSSATSIIKDMLVSSEIPEIPKNSTDVEILEIIPTQVVENVDMVKGKSGIVRVVVRNNGFLNAIATVNATLDGSLLSTYAGESATKLINASKNQTFDFSFNPSSVGTSEIIAEVKVE